MERRGSPRLCQTRPSSLQASIRRAKAPANFIDSRRRESSCSLPPICGIRVFRELMLCLKQLRRLKTTRVATDIRCKTQGSCTPLRAVVMTEFGCMTISSAPNARRLAALYALCGIMTETFSTRWRISVIIRHATIGPAIASYQEIDCFRIFWQSVYLLDNLGKCIGRHLRLGPTSLACNVDNKRALSVFLDFLV